LCGLVVLLVFLRLVTFGPTFVPGMLAAVPAAGLGIAVGIVKRDRVIPALTLAPIPLVWATQYSGAAEAQWAGRYILTSGVVLAVYGAVHAARRSPRAVVGFIAANLVMTMLGVTYLVVRTNDFGEANRTAAEIDGVVVFTQSFLAREGAPLGWDRQWLSAQTDEQRATVVDVLDRSGNDRFTLISSPVEGQPVFTGFEHQPNPVELSYGSLKMIETIYVRNAD
ncbi:MAG: hypothetical protein KJN63_10665, partial [Acidimicrobiia bacterium]|nr:hypothetical protein [Acidimicrobiia bacterium]